MALVARPSRYQPLQRFLEDAAGADVTLTFAQIESLIGGALPRAARGQMWWRNQREHPQARAWLAAGWRMQEVNVQAGEVTFGWAERSWKYAALRQHLEASLGPTLTLTRVELEHLVGLALPASAWRSRGWWRATFNYAPSRRWQGVGWRVDAVDLREQTVTFVRQPAESLALPHAPNGDG